MPELHDNSKDIVCMLKHVRHERIMNTCWLWRNWDSKTTQCDCKQTVHQKRNPCQVFWLPIPTIWWRGWHDDVVDMMVWMLCMTIGRKSEVFSEVGDKSLIKTDRSFKLQLAYNSQNPNTSSISFSSSFWNSCFWCRSSTTHDHQCWSQNGPIR